MPNLPIATVQAVLDKARAATPGRWCAINLSIHGKDGKSWVVDAARDDKDSDIQVADCDDRGADAAYIAAADPTTIAAALTELLSLRAMIAEYLSAYEAATPEQRARLRELALAATCDPCQWATAEFLESDGWSPQCAAYIAAAHPQAILALLTAHDALAARVRELDEQVNTLLNKNGDRIVASLLRTCLRCRRPFERESDIYRCVDCDAELHKDCAIQHFGQRVWPPTQACAVDAALREERAETQRFQQALKSAETLKTRAEEEKDALAAENARLRFAIDVARTAAGWTEQKCGKRLDAIVRALDAGTGGQR